MRNSFTVREASGLTGISKPALRVYTNRYARWLSTEATPERGLARSFTAADLKLLRFVYEATRAGETHERVQERLDAGELDRFEWSHPEEEVEEEPEPGQAGTAMA